MANFVQECVNEYSNNIILVGQDGSKYQYEDIEKIAAKFRRILTHRSLVFWIAKNNPASILGYFALLSLNHVVVPLSDELEPSLLRELITKYRPNFIWAPKENFLDKILFSLREYSMFCLNGTRHTMSSELALLLSTSGSSGSPKFVRLSSTNLYYNAKSITKYLSLNASDSAITTLPASYSFGLSILHSHLVSGGSILAIEHPMVSKEFWDFYRQQLPTAMYGTPFIFSILKKVNSLKIECSGLRILCQAGGRLSDILQLEFAKSCEDLNIDFFVMYGQTEASPRISFVPPLDASRKLGSIGVPIPGGSLNVYSKSGILISEPFITGELIYEGPNVFLGYAELLSDLNAGDLNRGVLRTGDLGYRDKDGYFYLVGRGDRFTKIAEHRINLDEVENIAQRYYSECAVVEFKGLLYIFFVSVVRGDVDDVKIGKIITLISNELRIPKRNFRTSLLDSLPRKSSGKIDYVNLRGRIFDTKIV